MTKINTLTRALLYAAIHETARDYHVDIYDMNGSSADDEEPLVFGLNWGGWGTQTAEESKKFAERLLQAVKIAEVLTKAEIVIDWSSDSDIRIADVDKETRHKCLVGIKGLISLGDADLLKEALKNVNEILSGRKEA